MHRITQNDKHKNIVKTTLAMETRYVIRLGSTISFKSPYGNFVQIRYNGKNKLSKNCWKNIVSEANRIAEKATRAILISSRVLIWAKLSLRRFMSAGANYDTTVGASLSSAKITRVNNSYNK